MAIPKQTAKMGRQLPLETGNRVERHEAGSLLFFVSPIGLLDF